MIKNIRIKSGIKTEKEITVENMRKVMKRKKGKEVERIQTKWRTMKKKEEKSLVKKHR